MGRHILPYIGDVKLVDLTSGKIEQWNRESEKPGYSVHNGWKDEGRDNSEYIVCTERMSAGCTEEG